MYIPLHSNDNKSVIKEWQYPDIQCTYYKERFGNLDEYRHRRFSSWCSKREDYGEIDDEKPCYFEMFMALEKELTLRYFEAQAEYNY